MASALRNSARTGKIVQAAAQLFARQGYHGTSTREIARLADISEDTLFRYFERKEDIVWSALKPSFSGLRLRKELLYGIAECEAPEVVLPQILALLVKTVTFKPQLLCLIAVAMIQLRWRAESICQEHPVPVFAAFTRYLARNIETGLIRNLDPRMITSALAMTVIVRLDLPRLISGGPSPHPNSRDAVRACIEFWLDILTPKSINRSRDPMEIIETPTY